MSKFLIATAANDIHAVIVELALQSLGESCFRWLTSDFPIAQRVTIQISDSGGRIVFEQDGTEFCIDLLTEKLSFWNRRVVLEHSVLQTLCESDQTVARRESRAFSQGLVSLLDGISFSVNRNDSARRAESKQLQLISATRCGWKIPETLIGNDPHRIRGFVERTAIRTLAKQFSPTVWKSESGDFVTRSAITTGAELPEDEVLQACPMIFQDYQDKSFEVRITCFRETFIGVRLDSQINRSSQIDWRAVSPARLGVELIEIPSEIESACIRLMRDLDLLFGCIDVVVTPSGEWVFLEINQMGQFLWIEELSPDIPMLDMFVQLLMGLPIARAERRLGLRYGNFAAAAAERLRSEQPLRVPKIQTNVVMEP